MVILVVAIPETIPRLTAGVVTFYSAAMETFTPELPMAMRVKNEPRRLQVALLACCLNGHVLDSGPSRGLVYVLENRIEMPDFGSRWKPAEKAPLAGGGQGKAFIVHDAEDTSGLKYVAKVLSGANLTEQSPRWKRLDEETIYPNLSTIATSSVSSTRDARMGADTHSL
jgi:hypothetical protein